MSSSPAAERPTAAATCDLPGLVLPVQEVLRRALNAGDGRRDLRQLLVSILREAGVRAYDEVGIQRGDLPVFLGERRNERRGAGVSDAMGYVGHRLTVQENPRHP